MINRQFCHGLTTSMMSKSSFIILFFVVSCSNRFSEFSICSNLQEGDSISVAFYSKIEQQYTSVNGVQISDLDVKRGRVDIQLPDSLIKNILALSVTIHHCSDTVLTISSIQLNGYHTFYPEDIMRTLWWQDGLLFQLDKKSNTISSRIVKNVPSTFPIGMIIFYQYRPIGIQIILRLSLLATFLIILFLFYRRLVIRRGNTW